MLYRIDIEYADPCAERIADVIGRLDELGDAVDGTIAAAEAQMMLTRLKHLLRQDLNRTGSGAR